MELSGGGADHTIEFIGRLFSRLYHNTFHRYIVEHLSGLFKEYLLLCWVWLHSLSNMYIMSTDPRYDLRNTCVSHSTCR